MDNIKVSEPLFGGWQLGSPIGSGGTGTVYVASRETETGKRYCAIKHIPVLSGRETAALKNSGADEAAIAAKREERLFDVNREIAIAQRLGGHKEILPYEESVTMPRENGGYDVFIRMELMESLAERVAGKPLSRDEAITLGTDISAAIAACAAEGIVHRNIKPENIFIDSDGHFKLGDTGCARVIGSTAVDSRPVEENEYTAPEVFKGGNTDETSDMYSLGLIMYRIMNRSRMPFMPAAPAPVTPADSEKALIRRMAGAELPAPKDADERLSAIILKACAHDEKDRFASAAQMHSELERLSMGLPSECGAAEKAAPMPAAIFAAPAAAPAAAEAVMHTETAEPMPTAEKTAPEKKAKAEKKPRKEKKVREKPEKKPAKQKEREKIARAAAEEEEEGSEKKVKAATVVTLLIALLALMGIFGLLAKKAYDKFVDGTREPDYSAMTPEIRQDQDNKDLYHVTVYAKHGSTLVYETPAGLRQEYAVPADNRLTFDITGTSLLPDEPIDSTAYSAQPKIYRKGSDGTLTPVAGMGYIMIDIPELPITIDSGEEMFTDEGSVIICGRVQNLGTQVLINGEEAELGPDGSFSSEIAFEENGVFEIPIEARLPKYSVFRQNVSVTVSVPDPPVILLPWDLEEPKYSQRVTDPGDTVEVHGMIPEGTTFEVSCENDQVLITEPVVGEDGSFSFTAALPEIGDYVITLSCTDQDGLVNTRQMHVQRAPEYEPYILGSWAMSYDALMRAGKQAYNIKGTVTEILQHGDYFIVMLQTSDGSMIQLEYHNHYPTANTFIQGKTYSWIYGHSVGRTIDGIPMVYVWFVSDK